MRTTLTIDDELYAKAANLAPPGLDKSSLLRECIKSFIQQQSAKRLAALGGQIPNIPRAPRRREAPTR